MNIQHVLLDVLAEKYSKGDETTIDEVLTVFTGIGTSSDP